MILQIYTLFLVVSIVLLFYGWYVKIDFIRILASVLLFILAIMISPTIPSFTGSLEYKVGEDTNTTFNYVNNTLISSSDIQRDINETFSNHTLSFYLTLLAIFNFIGVMIDRRKTL